MLSQRRMNANIWFFHSQKKEDLLTVLLFLRLGSPKPCEENEITKPQIYL